jgi:hypothetical protein
MTAPNPSRSVNPTPKARFQLSAQNISAHRELVDKREFERASDFALLQFQAELCDKENNPTIVGLKIAGAQEFLKVLRALSENEVLKIAPRPNDNLAQA